MIPRDLYFVLAVLLLGEGVIAVILFIVHIIKVREIRELKKEVEACKNSFGGYLSLLDKRNLKLIKENGVLEEEIKKLEESESPTHIVSRRK